MSTISTLPAELIREICHHMRDGDDQVDSKRDWKLEQTSLMNLCRTSKAFDQIARPVLYNRIEISLRQPTLMSLIRTLASRNNLSRIVQHLKLNPTHSLHYNYTLSNTDIDICTQAFGRWWPEGVDHPDFYHALCKRNKLADLLYILAPNVETMRCLAQSGRERRFDATPSGILRQICRLRNTLQGYALAAPLGRLAYLDVRYNSREEWNVSVISPLASVSLASLTIREYAWPYGVGMRSTYVNLRELSLYDCSVEKWEMDHLITACRGLRKFTYTARDEDGVTIKDCITALKRQSHTLTDLYLLIRDDDPLNATYDDSFHSFTSLRTLTIHPLDFIRNEWDPRQTDMKNVIDTLPQSLEVFKLIEWDPAVTYNLIHLGEMSIRGDLPNLRLLEVQCHPGASYPFPRPVKVNLIKEELADFEDGDFMLPLRISVCDGDGMDPLAESVLEVLYL